MLHSCIWFSSISRLGSYAQIAPSVRVSVSGFCPNYIILLSRFHFAKNTHYFVMTDTATNHLIGNIETSRIEGMDLCVGANESLETIVGCINGLTKTSEDIAQFLRTLTRILNKQDSANKDLATKLDTVNLNITTSFTTLVDRLENSLNSIGEQLKHSLIQCTYCWKFSNCRKLSEHLFHCSGLKEPFFHMYPLYYVEDQQRRRYIDKRFKQPLNSDGCKCFRRKYFNSSQVLKGLAC